MVWAVLVAVGVAVVSMTLFGARLTKRPPADRIVDDLDAPDPSDPWAAWKPRPFEELDRPRARIWPVLCAFTGLALVGAGLAGARQTLWATETTTAAAQGQPRPYTVQVDIPATPTMKPTPVPTPTPAPRTPAPTAAPAAPAAPSSTGAPKASAAATAAPAGTGPTLSGSSNCAGGSLTVSYAATAHGSPLSWIAVWADGKAVKGGPVSGESHSSSYSQPATPGGHDLEVTVEDKAGRSSRKVFHATCA
jgi:hypothetical protein